MRLEVERQPVQEEKEGGGGGDANSTEEKRESHWGNPYFRVLFVRREDEVQRG